MDVPLPITGNKYLMSYVLCLMSKEIVLGHPCIPRVRVNKGGDKRPTLRKKGRDWYQGEGGEGAGQIQGVKG